MTRARFRKYVEELAAGFEGRIQERVGMKRYTTFRIGGLAEVMVRPRQLADLARAMDLARNMDLPWRVIGSGSNLLIGDGGVKEVLILTADAFLEIEDGSEADAQEGGEPKLREGEEARLRVGAGVKMAKAVKHCQVRGWSGLEFAAGIPGSAGGAVVMNAGSLGSSMAEAVEWVEWRRPGAEVERTPRPDLDYAYRKLSRPADAAVVACGIKLRADDPRAVRERIVKGLKWRRQAQPLAYPSAGSVFKNPPGDFAGRMIEAAGLKGMRIGDAQISEIHANFIVNRGRARSRDVMELIERARTGVVKAFGVELALEIEAIGEELQ